MKNFTDSSSSLSDSVSESAVNGAEPRPNGNDHCQTTFIGLRYNSESNSSCSTSELEEDSESSEGDKSLRDWLRGTSQQQQVRTDSSESQNLQVKSQSSGSGQGQGQRSQSFRYLQPQAQALVNNNVESGPGAAAAAKSDKSDLTHSDSELPTSSESCSSSEAGPTVDEPEVEVPSQVNHPNQKRQPNQQLQARIKKNQRLLDKLQNQSQLNDKRPMESDNEFLLNRPQWFQNIWPNSPTQLQDYYQDQNQNQLTRKKFKRKKYISDNDFFENFNFDYDSIDTNRRMNQVVAGGGTAGGLNAQLMNILDGKEVNLNKIDQLAFADEEGQKKKKKGSSDGGGGGGGGDNSMIYILLFVSCCCVLLVAGFGGGVIFWQQEQQRLEAEALAKKNKELQKKKNAKSSRGSGGSSNKQSSTNGNNSRLGSAKSKAMKSKGRGKGGRSEAGYDESGSVLRGEDEDLETNQTANKQEEISMAWCGLGCIFLLFYGGCAICCYCAGIPCVKHCVNFVEKKTNIPGMVIAGCITFVCCALGIAQSMTHSLDPLLGKIPVIGDKLVNLTKTQAVQTHHWEKIGHGSHMSYDEANHAIKVNGDHDVVVRDTGVDGKHQYQYQTGSGDHKKWVDFPKDAKVSKINEVTTGEKGTFDLQHKEGANGEWKSYKHVDAGQKDHSLTDAPDKTDTEHGDEGKTLSHADAQKQLDDSKDSWKSPDTEDFAKHKDTIKEVTLTPANGSHAVVPPGVKLYQDSTFTPHKYILIDTNGGVHHNIKLLKGQMWIGNSDEIKAGKAGLLDLSVGGKKITPQFKYVETREHAEAWVMGNGGETIIGQNQNVNALVQPASAQIGDAKLTMKDPSWTTENTWAKKDPVGDVKDFSGKSQGDTADAHPAAPANPAPANPGPAPGPAPAEPAPAAPVPPGPPAPPGAVQGDFINAKNNIGHVATSANAEVTKDISWDSVPNKDTMQVHFQKDASGRIINNQIVLDGKANPSTWYHVKSVTANGEVDKVDKIVQKSKTGGDVWTPAQR